jgi:parallel beta helix pectate lyase-like protein/pectate lyase-like protein/copper-binding protein NosD
VSVYDFGAKGDGVADDTEALQRAVSAGGRALFPRGSYLITRPLEVELAVHGPASLVGEGGARLVMAGGGPALRVIGTHSGTAHPDSVSQEVWDRERMPVLEGLEIVGAHPEADGVELSGGIQAILSRLLIRECRHGIRLADRNRNVIVSDCHLYHNRGAGLYLDGANLHQINVHGCHISYNRGGGVVIQRSEVRNLQVVGNDIEYNYDPQAEESADLWIETGGRSVREGAICGNTIQSLPSPGGANVRIVGESAGISQRAGLLSISGNHISSQEANVSLQYARGVVINGNTFQSGRLHALLLHGSSNVVIGANVFDQNPDYGADWRGGIRMEHCRGCQLSGFLMDHCPAGSQESGACVEVLECEDVFIHGLQILSPEHRGIELRNSRHCTVSGCHIRDRRPQVKMLEGIRVIGGGGNWITGNCLGMSIRDALHLEAGSGEEEYNQVM